MWENLGLDASERYVLLLNNLGRCLSKTSRAREAIGVLESARDTAEKLAESDEPTVCKTKVYTSLAIAYYLVDRHSKEAVHYAKKQRNLVILVKLKRSLKKARMKNSLKYYKSTNNRNHNHDDQTMTAFC